jgi:Icc-related predicted phosphoesterase
MKIAIASDLHLEFGDLDFANTDNADVLILSGDICVATDIKQQDSQHARDPKNRSKRLHDFFQRCSDQFPHVIYVLGNHEHYHGDFAHTEQHLKQALSYLKNLYILEREIQVIDDTVFVGGTLWTDMNREDPLTMTDVRKRINDFRAIKNSNDPVHFRDHDGRFHTRTGHFSPENSIQEHRATVKVIADAVANNPGAKIVVAGHHAPSHSSIKPKYHANHTINGAYSSDLSEFILDRPEIQLWTHGHTHDDFDYMIGSCRVVCNPRGYIGYEERADSWELKTVTI